MNRILIHFFSRGIKTIIILCIVLTNVYGQIESNGGFESSGPGDITSTGTEGWAIIFGNNLTPPPVFEIVTDTVQEGSKALKVIVNGIGSNPWDIQAVADSIPAIQGTVYDYSIWAKAAKTGAKVNFTVGNYSCSEYNSIYSANLTTEWKEFKIKFTVNDNQAFIRAPIHFNNEANVDNAIFIDNLRIAEIDSSKFYPGPPFAEGASKFLGNAYDLTDINFAKYWNQLTVGNAGKFGSVATSMDTALWNWSRLDEAYNYSKENDLIFKDHCLIWGQQQPDWISELDTAQQLDYIETWFCMVGQRYPDIDMVDVVNEPLVTHNPPDGGNGRANYKDALGGNGTTGWDWLIKSFQLARKYMPNAELLINDYGIINDNNATNSYLHIINLLKERELIDGIGVQGHRFELENAGTNTLESNLDKLAATGLPIYISEMDLGNLNNSGTPNDNQQLDLYKKVFPVLWEHPGVQGITLWGYIEGQMWQSSCFLVRFNFTWRPALEWLAQYIQDNINGIEQRTNASPSAFKLEQNYPNPFNPSTLIRYHLPAVSHVILKIYDVLGREIAMLVDEKQPAGSHAVTFNANRLSSGVYYYSISAGTSRQVRKMVLTK